MYSCILIHKSLFVGAKKKVNASIGRASSTNNKVEMPVFAIHAEAMLKEQSTCIILFVCLFVCKSEFELGSTSNWHLSPMNNFRYFYSGQCYPLNLITAPIYLGGKKENGSKT